MKRYKIEKQPIRKLVTKPAKWLDVLVWLLTFGRKGKTYIQYWNDEMLYKPPSSINCRCSIESINKQER